METTRAASAGWPACAGHDKKRLPRLRRLREAVEQIVRVHRTRRRLGMVLHREDGRALDADAAVRSVEQRDMRLLHAPGQRVAIDGEAMVHRHDLDLAGLEILHRMVRAMMALAHLA